MGNRTNWTLEKSERYPKIMDIQKWNTFTHMLFKEARMWWGREKGFFPHFFLHILQIVNWTSIRSSGLTIESICRLESMVWHGISLQIPLLVLLLGLRNLLMLFCFLEWVLGCANSLDNFLKYLPIFIITFWRFRIRKVPGINRFDFVWCYYLNVNTVNYFNNFESNLVSLVTDWIDCL